MACTCRSRARRTYRSSIRRKRPRRTRGIRLGITGWNNKPPACGLWPRGTIPDGYHEPVSADVPVLIVSGKLDPVSPPERGEEVARHLPNSRHIMIAHGAHIHHGLTNAECIDDLMLEFLAKGDARDLDVACVERIQPPPFVTAAPK
ncbi:MAG: alpha/beta hydrolase [Verrucomicrobiaceae bacterium]|nr:alpha/beta hydrolase [Verrucomicrobiaceae bacterium]